MEDWIRIVNLECEYGATMEETETGFLLKNRDGELLMKEKTCLVANVASWERLVDLESDLEIVSEALHLEKIDEENSVLKDEDGNIIYTCRLTGRERIGSPEVEIVGDKRRMWDRAGWF